MPYFNVTVVSKIQMWAESESRVHEIYKRYEDTREEGFQTIEYNLTNIEKTKDDC